MRGSSLKSALQCERGISAALLAHVQAGEKHGNLAAELDKWLQAEARRKAWRRKLRANMAYPMVVFTSLVIVAWFLASSVLPSIIAMSSASTAQNSDLSLATRMLLWFYDHAGAVFVAVVAAACCCGFAIKRWSQHIPLLGGALVDLQVADAFRLMASLLRAGEALPLLSRTAMASCGQSQARTQVAHACLFAAQGTPQSEALKFSQAHPILKQVMLQGGGSQAFADALVEVADQISSRCSAARIDTLIAVASPVFLVFSALLVIWLLLALYGPIFAMGQGF